jgi:uncharacterized sulfatase
MMRAIVIVLAVLVPLFVYRTEVALFVVHHLIEATRDVGPPREIEWQRGPEGASAPPSERPPNIVLILADDRRDRPS